MHRGPWLQAGWFSISMYYHGIGVANTFNVKSIAHGIQQIETRKVYGEVGKSLALKPKRRMWESIKSFVC